MSFGAKSIQVCFEEDGSKLMSLLQSRLKAGYPRALLMKWVRSGQIRVDKKRAKPFQRLSQGQILRLPPQAELKELPRPSLEAEGSLDRVYEDQDLIILNKPPGLPVQPGSGHLDSLSQRLRLAYQASPWPPRPAHRLDRDTSGLVLCIKRARLMREVQQLWHTEAISKFYLAWLSTGIGLPATWQLWQDRIGLVRGPEGERMQRVSKGGKSARLEIRALRRGPGARLLTLIRLQTGRKHQIRVQAASRGMPVIGDLKYGKAPDHQGLLLHAWQLGYQGLHWRADPAWDQDYQLLAADRARLEPIGPG
jgi:23S rRNA pseudouridine955/2504/2580 synthase